MADSSDPTAGFTDMQWYMYRQRNVAFFAAFTDHALSDAELLAGAHGMVDLAPQLQTGFVGGAPDKPIPDGLLQRLIHTERVTSLDGFPDRWIDRGDAVLSDPGLPLFRIRHATLGTPPVPGQPAGFILVQVSHALVEGADSALLSRSQSAAHPQSLSERATPPLVKAAATGASAVLASLHLLAANLVTVRPGPFRYASRTVPRSYITMLAREHKVRQRALLFALVMHALFGAGTPAGKRRMSSTYSAIDDGGGADRDTFMRMRMKFASFDNAPDFPAFARAVDARLTEVESQESGFNAELNAGGVRMHRRLSRLIPFAYSPRLFQFMPYDVVIGLIPPHRLTGGLTAGLMEPVYAGAALEGANACVVVPNRRVVTFNFYIQEMLLAHIRRLDALLGPAVISGSSRIT